MRLCLSIFESDTFKSDCPVQIFRKMMKYEGDPRSNANPSVISFTFGTCNIKNGLSVYYDILSIL